MKIKNRQQWLMFAAVAVVAFFAADKLILTPLGNLWTERSKGIVDLRKKVENGARLEQREQNLRSRA